MEPTLSARAKVSTHAMILTVTLEIDSTTIEDKRCRCGCDVMRACEWWLVPREQMPSKSSATVNVAVFVYQNLIFRNDREHFL